MNKKVMQIKKYFGLLVLAILLVFPVSAQTELTTDMIWQEGTHWLYPFEITTDMYKREVGYYLMECKLVKDNYWVSNDSYLTVESRTNLKANPAFNHTWDENWEGLGFDIRVIDNKVHGYNLVEKNDTISCSYDCIMYDFDTWNSGDTIRFEVGDYDGTVSESSIVLGNSERIITDPDGKYFSYAFFGVDESNMPYYYIKNIGRINDMAIHNLVYYQMAPFFFWDEHYGGPDGIQALKIWHPDLGVLYQHPEYDRYMELTSGIEQVEADEAQIEPVITATAGAVTIAADDVTQVTVCTPTGAVVRQETIAGTVSYPLAPGIYIVRAGAVTRKVRV